MVKQRLWSRLISMTDGGGEGGGVRTDGQWQRGVRFKTLTTKPKIYPRILLFVAIFVVNYKPPCSIHNTKQNWKKNDFFTIIFLWFKMSKQRGHSRKPRCDISILVIVRWKLRYHWIGMYPLPPPLTVGRGDMPPAPLR